MHSNNSNLSFFLYCHHVVVYYLYFGIFLPNVLQILYSVCRTIIWSSCENFLKKYKILAPIRIKMCFSDFYDRHIAQTIIRWILHEQFNSNYENGHRSRVKYKLRIFFDVINTCIVNSGIVFNKLQENHQLQITQSLKFRHTIVRELIGIYKERIYAPPAAPIERRKSNETLPSKIDVTHLPEIQNVRKRCKLCTIIS